MKVHKKHHKKHHQHHHALSRKLIKQSLAKYMPDEMAYHVANKMYPKNLPPSQTESISLPLKPMQPKALNPLIPKSAYDFYSYHEDEYLNAYHQTLQQYIQESKTLNKTENSETEISETTDTPTITPPDPTTHSDPVKPPEIVQPNPISPEEKYKQDRAKWFQQNKLEDSVQKEIQFIETKPDGSYDVWYTDGSHSDTAGIHESLSRNLKSWEVQKDAFVSSYVKKDDGSYTIQYTNGYEYDSALADQMYTQFMQIEADQINQLAEEYASYSKYDPKHRAENNKAANEIYFQRANLIHAYNQQYNMSADERHKAAYDLMIQKETEYSDKLKNTETVKNTMQSMSQLADNQKASFTEGPLSRLYNKVIS